MEGREEPAEERGIIPNTFQYIFNTIAQNSEHRRWLRVCSQTVSCDSTAGWPSAELSWLLGWKQMLLLLSSTAAVVRPHMRVGIPPTCSPHSQQLMHMQAAAHLLLLPC